ncbi:DUF1289 domain-containing protein [Ancylobacter sp. A5.8]|uniref:DUF1289 domain-containing protein n=1 Tax=Ancylobacter gelatini TaxID=2919920 RepID=UPI001F4D62D3|nr:DUF1289 domain-containing protein [Ancylobacter gelatini]MCJ8142084.1 DUF1289 domain-containing protein [Ancylobacter gelatini]
MPMTTSTPCIAVCTLDGTARFCLGCGRTTEEIGAWATLDEPRRRTIMAELPARLGAARPEAAR